ncbi:MAG TPA: BON domain-containing protein [Thermoanaerobaculia bacterium]|nr:BON domain-containing protein [Thermoanaerobaculia bacterium]
MRRKTNVLFLMLILIVGATACSSLNQLTPKEWDDAAIEAEIRARIAADVTEKTFEVGISVNDGVVTLSGHAASSAQRNEIAQAARDVEGVRRVINNIHVQ